MTAFASVWWIGAADVPSGFKSPSRQSAAPSSLETNISETTQKAVSAAYASGDANDFRKAAELLEAEIRSKPDAIEARKIIVDIYLGKLEQNKKALPHLEKIVQQRPTESDWKKMLAAAYAKSGKMEEAAALYQKAAAADPKDVWTRYHLGGVQKKLGRPKEAESAYRAALAIDSTNNFVRIELAEVLKAEGRREEAEQLAQAILKTEPKNSRAHVLLGDLYRGERKYSMAASSYRAARASGGEFDSVRFGLDELEKVQEPQLTLAFYTFDTTDDFRQTGIFTHTLVPIGPVRTWLDANQLFFKQHPGDSVDRFETGIGADYLINPKLTIVGGVDYFKAERQGGEFGGNIALYVAPVSAVDFWGSVYLNRPVNDSIVTVRDAFTQDIFASGINGRFTPEFSANLRASLSRYSDGNDRRNLVAGLSYLVHKKTAAYARLEYEWLDFTRQRSAYSSPANYNLIRPMLQWSPQITPWLSLEVRGEVPYVVDAHRWGHGITIGPKVHLFDRMDLGFSYLNYKIPGGQSTWSGNGFKVDFSYRF